MYCCQSPGSWSSAKHASTGQASTQASQSMHSSGSMYSCGLSSNPGSSWVGVDSGDRTYLDAREILGSHAGLCDHVGHPLTLLALLGPARHGSLTPLESRP